MARRMFALATLVIGLAATAGPALARDVSVAIGAPGFGLFIGQPPPVVEYAPPVVYEAPPPAVIYPAPVYARPIYRPIYYYPRPQWSRHYHPHGHGHRKHHHHDD